MMTLRFSMLVVAGALFACSNTGTQSADAKGRPPQAAAPEQEAAEQPTIADQNRIYVQPKGNQPPPTVTVEQAEKACAGGVVRAARKEESNLYITLSICRKLAEMFPDSQGLKDAVKSLEQAAEEQGVNSPSSLSPAPAAKPSTAPTR
jgi:hypothetical protein